MQGSIRMLVGLVMCMAAVDSDAAPLYIVIAVAAAGLGLMASGVSAMKGAQ